MVRRDWVGNRVVSAQQQPPKMRAPGPQRPGPRRQPGRRQPDLQQAGRRLGGGEWRKEGRLVESQEWLRGGSAALAEEPRAPAWQGVTHRPPIH